MAISEDYAAAVVRAGRIGAFAPGGYLSKCLKCGITFDGDKRAINCLPCAVGALKARAGGVKPSPSEVKASADSQSQTAEDASGISPNLSDQGQ